jgi:hypothetical protein
MSNIWVTFVESPYKRPAKTRIQSVRDRLYGVAQSAAILEGSGRNEPAQDRIEDFLI